MDPAPAIGTVLAFVTVAVFAILEGGSPFGILLLPPMLLVFGATILVTIAGGTMADAKGAAVSLVRAFTGKAATPDSLLPEIVDLADRARREGLLSLESRVQELDDEFLRRGITMAIDGTDPEDLRDTLEIEVQTKRKHDKHAAKFWSDAGAYSPTIGIVGTVFGLIHVLENLAEPDKLGHMIAIAFVATLWGVMSANFLFLPIGNRLKRLSELEASRMEIAIEGIAAIQAGTNSRVVAQKLRSLMGVAEVEAA